MVWSDITNAIKGAMDSEFAIASRTSVSGGCINQGYRIIGTNGQQFFVKLNQADRVEMFETEALGLQQMGQTGTIRVPGAIAWGTAAGQCFLVLEWLDLRGRSDFALGQQLAKLHQYRGATAFGWQRDNAIGATVQKNAWMGDWAEFWRVQRLGVQLQLARGRGGRFLGGERLLDRVGELLAGHCPRPSLVHGDLWGGNASGLADGTPVIFDPAVYWGDREVDLAMTELFGGFSRGFYGGYNEVWPLDEGYDRRRDLYNLYHILNHYNLFGGSYERQANGMIDRLLNGD